MSSSEKNSTVKTEPVSYFKVALFLIIFGCVMLYLGMSDSTHYDELKKDCSFSTKATVTRLNEKGSKIAPVFEFEYQGRNYKHTGDVYKKKGTYEIGDTVKIYIDPMLPSRFYIPGYSKGETWNKFCHAFIIIFALLLLGMGIFVLVLAFLDKKYSDSTINHLDDVSADCIDEISTYEETDDYQ
ncbi:MAG: DUF3592 domain-containing protein [Ruminococcus sp.]|nr:DUF3592 domain-containing protein [Ruminococcus sp.]MBQ9079169.1 DUF3592 domain-containing protein [Ruminococcus sp.]